MIMKLLIMKVWMKYNFERNACIFTIQLADSKDNNTALSIDDIYSSCDNTENNSDKESNNG